MIAFALAILTLSITEYQKPSETDPDEIRCGLYCLTVALKSLGHEVNQDQVEKVLGDAKSRGYSMEQLNSTARSFGLMTTMSKTSLDQLKYRYHVLGERFVCLTLINDDHFIVLSDIEEGTVSICDPPKVYPFDSPVFEKMWQGQVLLLSVRPLKPEESVLSRRQRRKLVSRLGLGLMTGLTVFGLFHSASRINNWRKVKADA